MEVFHDFLVTTESIFNPITFLDVSYLLQDKIQ